MVNAWLLGALKEITWDAIPAAVSAASSQGRYRFSQRRLFYAIRPLNAPEIGEEPRYDTFASVLTEYEEQNERIAGLTRDPRGTLYHPHLGQETALGTLADSALDLGTLLAQLRRRALMTLGTMPDLAVQRTLVLDAYHRSWAQSPGFAERVAWYERVLLRKVHFLAGRGAWREMGTGRGPAARVAHAHDARLAEVTGIATLEPFRCRGVTSVLTSEAVRTALLQGVAVALLTAADEHAGHLYERIGFRPYATLLAYGDEVD